MLMSSYRGWLSSPPFSGVSIYLDFVRRAVGLTKGGFPKRDVAACGLRFAYSVAFQTEISFRSEFSQVQNSKGPCQIQVLGPKRAQSNA